MALTLPTLSLFRAIRRLEDFRVARELEKRADVQARDKEGRSPLVALMGALSLGKLDLSPEVAMEACVSIERQLLAAGAPVEGEVVMNGENKDPLIVQAFIRSFFAVLDDDFPAASQMHRLGRWLDRLDPQNSDVWGPLILDQWNSEMVSIGEDEDLHVETIAFGVQVAEALLERGVKPVLFHELLDEGGDYHDRVMAQVMAFERRAQAPEIPRPQTSERRRRRERP